MSEDNVSRENLEKCAAAIRAFFTGKALYMGKSRDFFAVSTERKLHNGSNSDQYYLAESGDDGLRYGAPNWGHLKLCYNRYKNYFYLDSNGMNRNGFLEFQEIIKNEFDIAGLPFESKSS